MCRRESLHWSSLALSTVLAGLAWLGWLGAPYSSSPAETLLPLEHLPPGSASQRALLDSAFWWTQSVQAANDAYDDERAALQDWDPAAVSDHRAEVRRLLAMDVDGYLLRARRAAARAARLARIPAERERAARQLRRMQRGD